jgi:hypothetical protein
MKLIRKTNPKKLQAVREYCKAQNPCWSFGPANKSWRQGLITILKDVKPPLSKCGHNGMMDDLFAFCVQNGMEIPSLTCYAVKQDILLNFLKL